MLCNLVSRRTVDRNVARFYNRKRDPLVSKAIRNARAYHPASPEHERLHQGYGVRQFSMQSMCQEGFNSRALDLAELQLRKQQLMHRRLSSSSAMAGSDELDLLFRMWAKQHVPDLSMEEIQELEAFLNNKMDGPSSQIFVKHVPTSNTGVVERFQAWAALAYYSKSFQTKIR
jgi:succinate dehydrogenase flavin-adding protein (antitoxin of CptAB toxin-antitoxin module)